MPDSVMKQCGDAIVTVIEGLDLTGIEDTEVTLRKLYRDGDSIQRGVSVCPVPEREAPGTNVRDDYGYGFLIVMCQGTGHGMSDDIDKVTLWRQSIKRAFNNKRLTGVSECYICTFEAGDTFMPREYQGSRDVSSFVVRCWCREPRA